MSASSFYNSTGVPGPWISPVVGNMPPGPVDIPNTSTPAPAPANMPIAPVNLNTPLHDAVRANPAITPDQIVSLHDKITPQGAPPLSVQGAAIVKQQALAPIAASAPVASSSGPFNAAKVANTTPSAPSAFDTGLQPKPQPLVTPILDSAKFKPEMQGGVMRYPYQTSTGDVLYASPQEAKSAIDWSTQQPINDKIADVELLRSSGKTSANDEWDPYYINLARSLTGTTPQQRLQQFETAIARDHRPIVKFASDPAAYQKFRDSSLGGNPASVGGPLLAPANPPVRPGGIIPLGPMPPNVAMANAAQFAATTSPPSNAPTSAVGVANAARLQDAQASIDNSGPVAPSPTSAPSAPTPPVPYGPTDPNWLNQPSGTSQLPSFLQGGSLTPTPSPDNPAAEANAAPASTAPGAQPNHPSWLAKLGAELGKAAPLIAGAIIGGQNPGVGGAALQGWQSGKAQVEARNRADVEVKARADQQALENQRQATHDTDVQTQQALENQQKADEERTNFYDSLKGLSPTSQEERVKALTPEQAARIGVDPKTFYDKDGKFIPQTADTTVGVEKNIHSILGSYRTVGDAYNAAVAMGLPADNPDMAVLASKMGNSDADPKAENPFWNKQQTGNNVVNNDIKAGTAEGTARTRFSHLAQTTQADILKQFDNAPQHFKEQYGFDMPAGPIEQEGDVLKQQGLTETFRSHKANELLAQGRLDLSKHSEADINAYHKVMEGIGQQNANAHTSSAKTAATREIDTKNFNDWKMNKTSDPTGKSVYGSAWGPTYDKAVNTGISLSKYLASWREYNPHKPDPPDIVASLRNISAQVERMNTTAPPASPKVTARSFAGGYSGGTKVALSTGPVTLGKLTAQQYKQLSPADQSAYYYGMQRLKGSK